MSLPDPTNIDPIALLTDWANSPERGGRKWEVVPGDDDRVQRDPNMVAYQSFGVVVLLVYSAGWHIALHNASAGYGTRVQGMGYTYPFPIAAALAEDLANALDKAESASKSVQNAQDGAGKAGGTNE